MSGFDERYSKYKTLRESTDLTQADIGRKLKISRTTTKNYERAYRASNLTEKVVEGTTVAITDTMSKEPSKWNISTIMMYFGIALGIILVSILLIYLGFKAYRYFFPDSKKTILEETIEDISRTAQERAEEQAKAKYEQRLEEERRLRQKAEQERDECKRNCHKPSSEKD